jgi:hypothetical protein
VVCDRSRHQLKMRALIQASSAKNRGWSRITPHFSAPYFLLLSTLSKSWARSWVIIEKYSAIVGICGSLIAEFFYNYSTLAYAQYILSISFALIKKYYSYNVLISSGIGIEITTN